MIAASEPSEALTTPLIGSSGQIPNAQGLTRRKYSGKLAGFCILLAVVLERLAYYSLLGNLVVFLTTVLNWGPTATLCTTLLFTSFTWLACFLGGMSGDAVYGRMNTISLGLILYFVGFLFLPFITYVIKPDRQDHENGSSVPIILWLVAGLILISLGEGFFKSNMSVFGADQLENKSKFFSLYYWAINVGSLLGFGPVVYLQEKKGFVYGHGLPAGCLLLALVFFMLPRAKGYICNKPAPNIVKRIFQITREARRRTRNKTPAQSPSEYTGSGCYEDFVPIKHWLDKAMAKYGGSYMEADVDEVKVLLRMLPVFGFLIVYCILYYQVTSTFVIQGMHLNVKIVSFSIPVAWLGITNVIFVLTFLPLITKGLFPCLRKINMEPSYFTKIMIGMFIATLAMLSAAVVDQKRISSSHVVYNAISKYNVTGKNIIIFAQVAQFGLMGISEIFVMITGLEFAYCQAPKRVQSLVTGLFFVANGIGSMLASLLFEIYSAAMGNFNVSTHANNIGHLHGRLDYFFYGLAVLNFLNLLWFAKFTRKRDFEERPTSQSVNDYLRSNLRRTPQK